MSFVEKQVSLVLKIFELDCVGLDCGSAICWLYEAGQITFVCKWG